MNHTKHNFQVKIDKTVEDELVLSLLEVAAQLTKNGTIITQEVGLTTQQWLILLYICRDPNIPFLSKKSSGEEIFASDIAEALNVSKPNITNLIGSLLEKELITQLENDTDRRKKSLAITKKGKETIEKIESKRNQANSRLFAKLGETDKIKMLEYLHFCLQVLKKL